MAIGDDAQDAGMDLVPATSPAPGGPGKVQQGNVQMNKTRDYIAQFFDAAKTYADGLFSSISLSWGAITGKPATFPPSAHDHPATAITAGTFPGASYGVTGELYVGGHEYLNTVSPVVSSYAVMYRNGPDGRIGPSPSARKYKRDIAPYDGSILNAQPVTYILNDDPLGTVRVGFIADDLNKIDPLLVVHEDGQPEGVKYELVAAALLREVQRLNDRITALEADQ